MFYYYFRFFNYVCTIFGQQKPFLKLSVNISKRFDVLLKFWSLLMAVLVIGTSMLTIDFKQILHIKENDETAKINEVVVCLIIFITNLRRNDVSIELYKVINNAIMKLKLTDRTIKMFAIKLYVWISFISIFYCMAIVKEITLKDPPFVLLLRIPLYISLFHLYIHLSLLLALLKVINIYISQIFKLNPEDNFLLEQFSEHKNVFGYIIDFDISFIRIKHNKNFDIKYLCKLYDDLSSCVQLLQKLHGIQILLTIWLMFSSAVSAVALVSTEKTDDAWLNVINGLLPFFWFTIGCYLDDQMRQEVERTDIIIIKLLIDCRCGESTTEVLSVFKQAISTNSLQFTAGNMYRLNYATMLGTVVSVITYSIIVIQLF